MKIKLLLGGLLFVNCGLGGAQSMVRCIQKFSLPISLGFTGLFLCDDYKKAAADMKKLEAAEESVVFKRLIQSFYRQPYNTAEAIVATNESIFEETKKLIPDRIKSKAISLLNEHGVEGETHFFFINTKDFHKLATRWNMMAYKIGNKNILMFTDQAIASLPEYKTEQLDAQFFSSPAPSSIAEDTVDFVLVHEVGHIYHNHLPKDKCVYKVLKDDRIPATLAAGTALTMASTIGKKLMHFSMKNRVGASVGLLFTAGGLCAYGFDACVSKLHFWQNEAYNAHHRKNEREADAFVAIVAQKEKNPQLLARYAEFFEVAKKKRPVPYPSKEKPLFRHPGDQERIDFFKQEQEKLLKTIN